MILESNEHKMIVNRNDRAQLDKKQEQLNKREQEIDELQRKLNDQILKLGIVQGVNNDT
jgi:hypothetical protein